MFASVRGLFLSDASDAAPEPAAEAGPSASSSDTQDTFAPLADQEGDVVQDDAAAAAINSTAAVFRSGQPFCSDGQWKASFAARNLDLRSKMS